MTKNKKLPKVSIIVPVYNTQGNIAELIESLIKQSYPKSKTEILVVDNKSTDKTVSIIKKYPVKLLYEDETQSSYAARNKGIENAEGEIIAFIDGDCKASKSWVEEGEKALRGRKADLVGGKVKFYFKNKKSQTELYDALANMDNKKSIEERSVAKTANLLVRKYVFDKIGLFPIVKSGGDVSWTKKVTDNNYKLVYSEKALVYHPTRDFKESLKKQYRVGNGLIEVFRSEGESTLKIIFKIVKLFIPPNPSTVSRIRNIYKTRDMKNIKFKNFNIWLISYALRFTKGLGVFHKILMQRKL